MLFENFANKHYDFFTNTSSINYDLFSIFLEKLPKCNCLATYE